MFSLNKNMKRLSWISGSRKALTQPWLTLFRNYTFQTIKKKKKQPNLAKLLKPTQSRTRILNLACLQYGKHMWLRASGHPSAELTVFFLRASKIWISSPCSDSFPRALVLFYNWQNCDGRWSYSFGSNHQLFENLAKILCPCLSPLFYTHLNWFITMNLRSTCCFLPAS